MCNAKKGNKRPAARLLHAADQDADVELLALLVVLRLGPALHDDALLLAGDAAAEARLLLGEEGGGGGGGWWRRRQQR